ncbi:hypothetical protein BKI52_14695 [marine bacterium AO1-C]|nr:hypothetical protein BKI52_14695 [marine bacterium AO1-C]
MKKVLKLILGLILLGLAPIVSGQPQDARIISWQKIKIKTSYTQLRGLPRWYYDSTYYEAFRQDEQVESFRILYKSDTAQVEGFLVKPKITKAKHPVIVYNRGGTGNYSKITEEWLPDFYDFVKQGFVVLVSNTRFTGKFGLYDQLGGIDLNDIEVLMNISQALPYCDLNNYFMLGLSRGGQMTYQLLKRNKYSVNAAAVIAGPANLVQSTRERPEFLEGWNDDTTGRYLNYKGLKNILPHFKQNKAKYLQDRSAVYWADKINVPLLLLHSRQDGFVNVSSTLDLATQLQKYKKRYQLIIYDKKSHSLPVRYFPQRNQQIIQWFKQNIK